MESIDKQQPLYKKSGLNLFPAKNTIQNISLGSESIFFFCDTKITEIKFEDVRIELYKNKYYSTSATYGSSSYYLYFSHAMDDSIWLELSDYYFKLGEVLLKLSHVPDIQLGDREFNFLTKFEREWKEYNSPRGRLYNRVIIPLALVSIMIIIFYTCRGR